jgi:molecular chaperone IbpA
MTKVDNALLRYAIGLDPWFFERSAGEPNFPPHNIIQLSEDRYRLVLAIAGFAANDLDIYTHNDMLTISGQRTPTGDVSGEQALYSGIAFRDFSRQFKIGEHVVVDHASLKDGLLEIELVRHLPEAMKPKKIMIDTPNSPQRELNRPQAVAA